VSNPVNLVAPSPYLDRPRLPASSSVVLGSLAARVAAARLAGFVTVSEYFIK